jgi:hypothetical protein
MAVPEYVPLPPTARPRTYESPDHVPEAWIPGRPAELTGPQPVGRRLGNQGPDQGFALKLADEVFRDRLELVPRELPEDAISGCVGIAMRRASVYGRAPTIHDLTIAFTIWGFLDPSAPADLIELRRKAFAGVGHVAHHYAEWRAIVDAVPSSTLQLTPQQAREQYPASWRDLVGA